MEKILSISLKLNFTPNTFGCYGLKIDPLRSTKCQQTTLVLTDRSFILGLLPVRIPDKHCFCRLLFLRVIKAKKLCVFSWCDRNAQGSTTWKYSRRGAEPHFPDAARGPVLLDVAAAAAGAASAAGAAGAPGGPGGARAR